MTKNSLSFLFIIADFVKKRFINLFIPENKNLSAYNIPRKKSSRTYITRNETLQLNSVTKLKVAEVNKNAKILFKELIAKPEELFKYIESKGALVVQAPNMDKALVFIGEKEGFIPPLNGFKAFFLTTVVNILTKANTNLKIGFNTPPIIAVKNQQPNFYYLAYQFHHLLSYINELPGYEDKTNENFKSILLNPNFGNNEIKQMTIDEILSLKEAIARDIEAIKFVKEVTRELIGIKNGAERLKNGENFSI